MVFAVKIELKNKEDYEKCEKLLYELGVSVMNQSSGAIEKVQNSGKFPSIVKERLPAVFAIAPRKIDETHFEVGFPLDMPFGLDKIFFQAKGYLKKNIREYLKKNKIDAKVK